MFLDIDEIYDQLKDYSELDSEGLSGVPWQFCELVAEVFTDLAWEVCPDAPEDPFDSFSPQEICRRVEAAIEKVVPTLAATIEKAIPPIEGDSLNRSLELEALSNLNVFEDDLLTTLVLLAYQYDNLCEMYYKKEHEAAYSVTQSITKSWSNLSSLYTLHIEALKRGQNRSESARDRASKRWQNHNEKKARLLSEWETTGNEYRSRADFCRIVGKREGVIVRTLYDWIAAHTRQREI